MTIHKIPQYRYALFKPWDKEAFALIKKIAKTKKYPKIIGSKEDKNQFLIMLIRTQKSLHGWRKFLADTLEQVKKTNSIDTKSTIKKYPPESIKRDTPAWITYKEDRIVSDFIDKLATEKVDFLGSDKEISEFTLRFILGQLSHDWEWTIMMIWEMFGNKKQLSVKELNKEMRNFDYLKLFE